MASICIVLSSCDSLRHPETEADFVESLGTLIRGQGEISQFDLAEATCFEWTALEVFRPYTPREFVHKRIGSRIRIRSIDYSDQKNLLVFTDNGHPVLTVDLSIRVCDFEFPPTEVPTHSFRVSAKDARFEVLIDDGGYCRATPINPMQP